MLPPISMTRSSIARSSGATRMPIGMDTTTRTTAPITPARSPTSAPSAGVIGVVELCCSRCAAIPPPLTIHRQQQRLPAETMGSADSTPIATPPMRAGCAYDGLVVVLTAKMRDQLFAFQVAQSVLQLHQLDEQVVLRIQVRRVHRALEVERQPFLNAVHLRALRQVEKQGDVEDDGRSEDAVAAQEIDLQLHLVAEPADEIDVVPALFVVAARRIVVDSNDVAKVLVEVGVQLRLQDVVEDRLLAFFLRLERFGIVEHFAVAIAEDVGRIPAFDAEQARLQPGRDDRLDQGLAGLQILARQR